MISLLSAKVIIEATDRCNTLTESSTHEENALNDSYDGADMVAVYNISSDEKALSDLWEAFCKWQPTVA